MHVELWLYGPIARYAGEKSRGSHAQLDLELPEGSTMQDLLDQIGLPSEEKGITFINGNLAALPGVDADRAVVLQDGDRVGISHPKSMWPHQYRFGASLTPQIEEVFERRKDQGIRHSYTEAEE